MEAEPLMRLALAEARRGLGRTSPNPVVGAVIVRAGRVIAVGHHLFAAGTHAEAAALRQAGKAAKGADLYTTLEPCDHHGRTPPCSEAILAAGIRRVFSGSSDPNPLVRGRGVRRLRRAGIEVHTGVLASETDLLNRPFFKVMMKGLPFVTLKAAVTLDGKLATATGDSRWVSGPEARAWVHRRRNEVDAVLVGANTARWDNPRLTTRLPRGKGRDPLRVVVDSQLRLPASLRLFTLSSEARTLVACSERAPSARQKRLEAKGVDVLRVEENRAGQVDLRALLLELARRGVLSVVAEGGAELFASLLRGGLADELALFIAPKLLGASGMSWMGELGIVQMKKARAVGPAKVTKIGEDFLLEALL